MAKTVLDMSMSLDGFVAGPNETPENGLGDRGEASALLVRCRSRGPTTEESRAVPMRSMARSIDEVMATGVGGRRDVAPSSRPDGGTATTTTACRSSSSAVLARAPTSRNGRWSPASMMSARRWRAPGRPRASVTSSSTASARREAALAAGVLDEVQIHLVPTLLGEGRRLFEGIGTEPPRVRADPFDAGQRRHPSALSRPSIGGRLSRQILRMGRAGLEPATKGL